MRSAVVARGGGGAVAAAATAALAAAALVAGGPLAALGVAAAPLAVLVAARRHVVHGLVATVVPLTLVFGRDLAHLHLGSVYALDLVLVSFLVLALPEVARAAAARPGPALLVVAIVLLSLAQLVLRGPSAEALRQSAIAFYAAWALAGIALARSPVVPVEQLARRLAGGAVAALAVYGLFLGAPGNPFTRHLTPLAINAAQSMYVGFAVLACVFAPALLPRRLRVPLVVVCLAALVEILFGEVRSIWVALPVAILAGLLATPPRDPSRRRALAYALAALALLVAGVAALPGTAERLDAEAASIYSHAGSTASDANARWRLDEWGRALRRIETEPLSGVGYGEATAYNYSPGAPPRPTDLHNSLIAFALRLGIPGFLLLAAFEGAVLTAGWRIARAPVSAARRQLALWLLACQVLVAVHACFTVVLEGPYMGLFFWLLGGLVIGLSSARGARA